MQIRVVAPRVFSDLLCRISISCGRAQSPANWPAVCCAQEMFDVALRVLSPRERVLLCPNPFGPLTASLVPWLFPGRSLRSDVPLLSFWLLGLFN